MLLVGFWLQTVHVQIDDWRCEEGKQLADDESPMLVMPSGRRSSDPVPVPKASGKAPNIAAKVVMMIGRKRSMQA